MRILICDDDPDMLFLLSYLLKKGNHETVTAQNKEEAITYFTGDFDLILMDYLFGEESGPDVLTQLQSTRETTCPAILVTALNEPLSFENGNKYGIVDVIHKPFDPEKIAGYFSKLGFLKR